MIRIPKALFIVLAALPSLPAQTRSEHKAAREQLTEAVRQNDLGLFLTAASTVGRHKTLSKGLAVVLENVGRFSADLTAERLEKISGLVADALDARLEKPLALWKKRYRRDLESPQSRAARVKILARERQRVEDLTAKVRHWFARVVLMEARVRKDGDSVVFAALRDGDPRVVRRAVHRLMGRQELRIIEEVLASYRLHAEETGAEWNRTFLKMQTLCARACGESRPSVADYQSWLASHRDLENPFEKKKKKRRERKARTGLFGLRVTGEAIMFVLDVSGSMNSVDQFSRQLPRRGRTGTTVDPAELAAQNTRLERSKRELASAIRRLPEGTRFGVITYAGPSYAKAWQRGLVAATAEAKDAVTEYIEGFTAGGSTATDVALALAFADSSLDTIYLISDGVPTHQGMRAGQPPGDTAGLTQAILDGVAERNLLRDVRVFTLGFPQVQLGYAFLSALARQNDGQFIKIEAD